jgi:hypothetical protein
MKTKATRNETVSGSDVAEPAAGSESARSAGGVGSAEGIKRFRTVIILVLAFVVGVVVLFSLISGLRSQRSEELAARFYAAFTKPVETGGEPDLNAVDAILAEARGRDLEQWLLRATVEHLLNRADEQDAEAASDAGDTGGSDAGTDAADKPAVTSAEARAKARSLVEDARDRIGSSAVLEWASSVIARLDGLESESWRPPAREYRLPPPVHPADGAPEAVPPDADAGGSERAAASADATPQVENDAEANSAAGAE